MIRVGVVLSGCGFLDGSEIQEAVFTLFHLDQAGIDIVCMAPNIYQKQVINHVNGEAMNETRNVLIESARICRGDIKDMSTIDPASLDAVIFPGGFGAASNLSSYATDKANALIDPQVERLIREIYLLERPLGFICISPVVAAKVLGSADFLRHKPLKMTIGTDKETIDALHGMNVVHESSLADDIVLDLENKVVSTPAYMLGNGPRDIDRGIEKLVRQVLLLADATRKVQASRAEVI